MDYNIQDIVIRLSMFIVAGSIHEFAHAASAYHLGDPTARDHGRLTINPGAHVDIIGTILFPILAGIGWMKPVPVYLGNLSNPLKDDAIISFAGPFSNFVQASLAIFVINLIGPNLLTDYALLSELLIYYAYINILLMGFNLIPFPPLDGGAIVRYFLPDSWQEGFEYFSRYSFIVLIILFMSGLLTYFLIPFQTLFNFMFSLPTYGLLALNFANLGIIAYFYKEEIPRLWNKSSISKQQVLPPTGEEIPKSENRLVLKMLKPLMIKLKENMPLTSEEQRELDLIRVKLNMSANICPSEDFDSEDIVCKNCEWLSNCMVRELEKLNKAYL